jgi:uncharacterized repeat protein (TIGR01451 family)
VRRCGLLLAGVLLGALSLGWPGRAAGQGPPRQVIATSHPPASPTPPLVPVPDANPKLLPLPVPQLTAPVATSPRAPLGGLRLVSGQEEPIQPAAPTARDAPAASTGGLAPTLYLQTLGPASQNLSQPFNYEIVLRNPGSATVFHVQVEDELPPGARMIKAEPKAEVQGQKLFWDLGSVEAGAERRLKVEVQPAGEGEFQSHATATFATSSSLRTRITKPRLTLAKFAPEKVQLGNKVLFRLVITNTGTGPATHVLLRDHLPPELEHPQGTLIEGDVGTLAAGESKTITLEATAIKGGRVVNQAEVTADDGLQASARVELLVTEPALLLRKTGPKHGILRRELEHRLEVVNPGQAPATSVHVVDTLPEGLEVVSASNGGTYTADTRMVDWNVGTLAPGETHVVTLRMLAKTAGDFLNQAVARADRGLEAKAGAPVHVEGIAALTFEVVDLDDPVEVGAETTYEIRVVNQGSAPALNVQIQTVVPDGMTPLGGDGPSASHVEGQKVSFDPVPKLAGRADALFRVRVRAVKKGDWRFKAYLTCDQLQRPVYEEESTLVYDDKEEAGPAPAPPAKEPTPPAKEPAPRAPESRQEMSKRK